MKKLISIFAALALVGSLAAQKKAAKAPAKAPAAPAAPAAKAPEAPAAPAAKAPEAPAAPAKKAETNWTINLWGGYNIVGETDFTKPTAGDTGTITRGGISGGLDAYYGSAFQIGLGAGYVSYYKYENTSWKITSNMTYVPVLLQARYVLDFGLYVGAGVGVATTQGDSKMDGTTLATYSGSAIAIAGLLGYQLGLSDSLALDLGARVLYLMQDVDNAGVKVKNNSVNIIPNLGVTFKF
jgi:hypothetical protein